MSTKASLILFIGLTLPILSEEPSSILETFTPTETINGDILALAVAPDGGAYFGGEFNRISGDSKSRFLAKMNSDGSLERTFTPEISGPVYDLLVQNDGMILAGGDFETISDLKDLARFHPDGSPDTAFNANLGGGSSGSVTGIDLRPDGKIIVAGSFTTWAGESLNPNRDLIVLNTDGTLHGIFPKGIFSASLTDVLALPDGDILAAHDTESGGAIKVIRFKSDFTQDSGFTYRTERRRVTRMNLANDGSYLMAGTDTVAVQADGSTEDISDESSNDILQQRNGKILVAGSNLSRFLSLENPDPDFSKIEFNPGGQAHRIALRPDGRIWVAGTFSSYNGTPASKIVLVNGDPIPLAIFAQPESLVRDPGGSARIEISAVGTSPLSYQWRKDGIALEESPRHTGVSAPVLEILDLSDLDNGNYSCLVTNEAGDELSESASLIVRGIPYFVVLPEGGNHPAGSVIRIKGEVIALGSVTYQWRKDGEVIAGATSNVLTLSQIREADTGNYTLEAENNLGTTTSQVAKIIVDFNPAAIAGDFQQPSLNGAVLAVEPIGNGAVLIGGLFTAVTDGITSGGGYLAVVEENGTIRDLPGLNANGAVRAINRDAEGNFLLAGDFTSVGGIFRSRVARLLPDLSVDPTFNPGTGPNSGLFNIREAPDGTLHVAGKHTAWNGDPLLNYHVRLDPDGTVDPLYYTPASNWINDAYPLPDGKILLGGRSFNPDGDTTTNSDNYLYRINDDGTFDTSFEGNVDFNSPTKLLIDQSGRIYANSPIGSILNRFLSDGSPDPAFQNDRPDQRVTSLFLDSKNRLLVGGRFEMFDDQERVRLLRLNADDSIDEEFISGVGPDNQVDAIAESDTGSIWIGGAFKNYNGVPASNLVRLVGGEGPVGDLLLIDYLIAAGVAENERGPNDDPDRDGLPNLVEYLYGSDPLDSQSLLEKSSLSIVMGDQITGSDLDPTKQYYVVELEIPKDKKGYQMIVEGSSNLIQFEEEELVSFGEPVDDGKQVRQTYYFLPDRRSAPQVFWRLRVRK